MKGICLWSHIALTREINVCIHSFSLPLIAHDLIRGPAKPGLARHTDIIMRMKPEQCLRIYDDMYSQLQILYHRVSTHNRSYLKRINLQNKNLTGKKKNDLQLSFVKIGRFSSNLWNR